MDVATAPAFLGSTVAATLWAIWERIQSAKAAKTATQLAAVKVEKSQAEQDLLSDAKRHQDRAEILGKLSDDNFALFVKEQAEHQKTRDFWHAKSSEFQTTLSSCQEKLQDMQRRPDYSEMLQILTSQNESIQAILVEIRCLKTPH